MAAIVTLTDLQPRNGRYFAPKSGGIAFCKPSSYTLSATLSLLSSSSSLRVCRVVWQRRRCPAFST